MQEPVGKTVSVFKGHNGQMVFDGETVTVFNKFLTERKGLEPTLIPLESIESVYVKHPTMLHSNGHIRIVTPNETGPAKLAIREATFHDKTLMVLIGKGGSAQKFAEDVMQAVRARRTAAIPLTNADKHREFRRQYGLQDDTLLAMGVNGYCSFDGKHLTLQPLGIGRLTVGKGVKSIPLQSVVAIQVKPAGPVVNGFIQFTVPGGNERRSEFGRQTVSAAGDENSIVFTRMQEAAFLSLRDAIEAAQSDRHTSQGAPSSPVLDQLAQLAGLRDSGIVTPEEFEEKKAELLGRL